MAFRSTYRLDHPFVQEMRKQFERRVRNSRLGFDDLFFQFGDPNISFAEIARKAGVTVQQISLYYNRYFKPLFGGKSGRERWHASLAARRAKMETVFIQENPILALISQEARKYGCSRVAPTPQNVWGTRYWKTEIIICRRRCIVRHIAKAEGTTPLKSKQAVRALELHRLVGHYAVIFICTVPGYPRKIFIVPSHVLRGEPPGAVVPGQKTRQVILPLEKRAAGSPPIELDLSKYENAWSMLREKE